VQSVWVSTPGSSLSETGIAVAVAFASAIFISL
jgi:hypothetical protein